MDVKLNTKLGHVNVTDQAIRTIVGKATTSSYGVIGMSSQNQIKDNLDKFFKNENYNRGVQIVNKDNQIDVNVFVVISYGSKVPEIAKSIQGNVKFQLKAMLGINPKSVNVFVTDVKVIKDNHKKHRN